MHGKDHLNSNSFLLGKAQLELIIEQQKRNEIGRPISEFVRTTKFEAYVRVGRLCFVDGERKTAIVLARIDIPQNVRGQRVFPAVLEMFEDRATHYEIEYVMVECVHHDWLVNWLKRNGFEMHGPINEGAPTLRKRVRPTSTNPEA